MMPDLYFGEIFHITQLPTQHNMQINLGHQTKTRATSDENV